jgi:hypothetical protein
MNYPRLTLPEAEARIWLYGNPNRTMKQTDALLNLSRAADSRDYDIFRWSIPCGAVRSNVFRIHDIIRRGADQLSLAVY